jgi:hypothetical protein
MIVTVVKIESRSFSSAELIQLLELKIRGVIITREYLYVVSRYKLLYTGRERSWLYFYDHMETNEYYYYILLGNVGYLVACVAVALFYWRFWGFFSLPIFRSPVFSRSFFPRPFFLTRHLFKNPQNLQSNKATATQARSLASFTFIARIKHASSLRAFSSNHNAQ